MSCHLQCRTRVTTLILVMATMCGSIIVGADAAVVTGLSGDKFWDAQKEWHIMCNKCQWTGATRNTWYELKCDSTAKTSTNWGVLHYGCNNGCSDCTGTTKIVLGEKLTAGNLLPVESQFYVTSASIGCCPKIIKVGNHTKANCPDEGKYTYNLAGCYPDTASGNSSSTVSLTHLACVGGSGPKIKTTCESDASQLSTGDSCPADTCNLDYYLTTHKSGECLRYWATYSGQQYQGTYEGSTRSCLYDEKQMCLRIVESTTYSSSMTPTTDDLTTLSCSGAVTARPLFFLIALVVWSLVLE